MKALENRDLESTPDIINFEVERPKRLTPNMVPAERARLLKENCDWFNQSHALARIKGRAYILIEEPDEMGNPSYVLSGEKDFYLPFKNKKLKLPKLTRGGQEVEWEFKHAAPLWLEHDDRRLITSITFKPNLDHLPHEYNLFKGFKVEPAADFDPANPEKGCDRLLDLMRRLSGIRPEDRMTEAAIWHEKWYAHGFQYPADKPGTAVVYRSKEGAGKGTWMNECIGGIWGSHYVHIGNRRHLTSNFNTLLQGAAYFFVDEAVWAGDKEGEGALKYLITEPTIMIEGKGKDAFSMPNLARIAFASNEKWVVPVGPHGRRFAVYDCDESIAQDTEYFAAVRAQIRAGGLSYLLAYFLHVDLEGWSDKLRNPPITNALINQKIATMRQDSVAHWFFERLYDGELYGEDDSLANGVWPREITRERLRASYAAYCKRMGVRYPASPEEIGKRLKDEFGAGEARSKKANETGQRPMLYTFIAPHEDTAGDDRDAYRLAHFRSVFERGQFGGGYDWPMIEDEIDPSSEAANVQEFDRADLEIPDAPDDESWRYQSTNEVPF